MCFERLDKRIAAKILIFPLTQGRKRVEPLKLSIDVAGVAHHQAPLRQPFEKRREKGGEIRIGTERIGSCEGRIRGDAELGGARTEFAAEPVDQQTLRI